MPAVAPPLPVAADPLGEAIRESVDHLRYASEHDGTDHTVRGARIVLADIVARYYEAQQFQPKWRDPARLDSLRGDLRAHLLRETRRGSDHLLLVRVLDDDTQQAAEGRETGRAT